MAYTTYDAIHDLLATFNNFSRNLTQQTELVRSLSLVHSNLIWIASETDADRRKIRTEVFEEFCSDFQKKLNECGTRCSRLQTDFKQYREHWEEIREFSLKAETLPLLRNGMETKMNPIAEELFDNLDRIAGNVVNHEKQMFTQSVSGKYLLLALSLFGLGLVILTTAMFFRYIRQSLLDPLEYLVDAMGRVSQDLSTRVEVKKSQVLELGNIAEAFNKMVGALQTSEAKIAQQNEIMLQSAKMASLGQMSAGVAHEINNPLAIISGSSQQLTLRLKKEPELFAETEKLVDRITRSVQRISKIVSGLKSFARDSSLDPKSPESIRKIVEESAELSGDRYRKSNVNLQVESIHDVQVNCRSTEIEQVLINLLGNALDAVLEYPPEQRWVKVDSVFVANAVQIRVIDGGHGIPEEVAKKMMDPFFTTKEVGKGTGLGLSISIGILKDHGGNLYLDRNNPNTCFVIEMPIFEAAVAA